VSSRRCGALVSGHWSAWQAARVEVMQQEQAKREKKQDLPGEVVDRLVATTDVAAKTG